MKMDYFSSAGLDPAGIQPGWLESFPIATPAAGAGVAHSVPGQFVYRVDAIAFQLVTSAAVANRIPVIDYVDPDGNIVYEVSAALAVAAGATVNVFAMTAYAPTIRTATGGSYVALPDTLLKPMWQIQVNVGAIDVADQISKIRIRTWRFPESLTVPEIGE